MTADDEKAARLAQALRANLARRKVQMRARRDAEAAPASEAHDPAQEAAAPADRSTAETASPDAAGTGGAAAASSDESSHEPRR